MIKTLKIYASINIIQRSKSEIIMVNNTAKLTTSESKKRKAKNGYPLKILFK